MEPPLNGVSISPRGDESDSSWHGNQRDFADPLRRTVVTSSDCELRVRKTPTTSTRSECPDCWHETEWVEAPQAGRIYTWSGDKYPGELFKLPAGTPLISVELEGVCTKLMSWLKEGEPEIGMPVKAVFNTEKPTNTILDLAWVPA